MRLGLIGKKIGMTREFFDSGVSIPVTVLKIEKGRVIDIYTKEKNGYSAVKLGFINLIVTIRQLYMLDFILVADLLKFSTRVKCSLT